MSDAGNDSTVPAKRAAIQNKITRSLIDELGEAGAHRRQRTQDYRRRAEDLATLKRMRLLPPYAADAVKAYREVDPSLDDNASRETVLALLIDCYSEAANA